MKNIISLTAFIALTACGSSSTEISPDSRISKPVVIDQDRLNMLYANLQSTEYSTMNSMIIGISSFSAETGISPHHIAEILDQKISIVCSQTNVCKIIKKEENHE